MQAVALERQTLLMMRGLWGLLSELPAWPPSQNERTVTTLLTNSAR